MKYNLLVLFGLILWLSETAFFGWNETPQSGLEAMLDSISWLFIVWGIIGDVLKGLRVSKHYNITAPSFPRSVQVMRQEQVDGMLKPRKKTKKGKR